MNSVFDQKMAQEVAKLLLKIKAVTFQFDPPYTYTSGLKSPVYLDNRIVMSYPAIRTKIVDYYIQTIKKQIGLKNIDWISATATAAIPQGAFVANALKLPMVYVRPTTKLAGSGKKSYGKGNKMEGYLKKGAKVVIIEDHISTATSVSDNAESIRDEGGKVQYCVACTTYETKLSADHLSEHKVKLFSLTNGKIIVETAFKHGELSKKEKESVDLWFSDPPNWAKEVGLE